MSSTACMGGWACIKRDRCQHHANTGRPVVVERLCEQGRYDAFRPMPANQAPMRVLFGSVYTAFPTTAP